MGSVMDNRGYAMSVIADPQNENMVSAFKPPANAKDEHELFVRLKHFVGDWLFDHGIEKSEIGVGFVTRNVITLLYLGNARRMAARANPVEQGLANPVTLNSYY